MTEKEIKQKYSFGVKGTKFAYKPGQVWYRRIRVESGYIITEEWNHISITAYQDKFFSKSYAPIHEGDKYMDGRGPMNLGALALKQPAKRMVGTEWIWFRIDSKAEIQAEHARLIAEFGTLAVGSATENAVVPPKVTETPSPVSETPIGNTPVLTEKGQIDYIRDNQGEMTVSKIMAALKITQSKYYKLKKLGGIPNE